MISLTLVAGPAKVKFYVSYAVLTLLPEIHRLSVLSCTFLRVMAENCMVKVTPNRVSCTVDRFCVFGAGYRRAKMKKEQASIGRHCTAYKLGLRIWS